MKTSKIATALLLVLNFSLSAGVMAEELTLNGDRVRTQREGTEVGVPEYQDDSNKLFKEGTERELTLTQIQEILPWAKNTKLALEDLLGSLDGLSTEDKIEKMVNGIKFGVMESAPKHSELFMRYTLNRALVIDELFTKEMDQDAVGSSDVRLRVMMASVKMALRYYETDIGLIEKRGVAPYARFGLEYFRFLNDVNKSVFDASAQYKVGRVSLQWLQVDLHRDLNNHAYAPQIVKINNELKVSFPDMKDKKVSDAKYISLIRQMKGLIRKLLTL